MVPGFGEVHLVLSRVQGSVTKDSPRFKGTIAFLCCHGHHEFLQTGYPGALGCGRAGGVGRPGGVGGGNGVGGAGGVIVHDTHILICQCS